MYRKYHSSTKSSRNERLAQLSEQESVIEKKKREILAKVEAQKKKETEEAMRKLEPLNVPPNADKSSSVLNPFAKQSFSREKKVEDDESKVPCPRNAFSNDGSFLDQFKKLSSELGQKNLSLSMSGNISGKDQDLYGGQKSRNQYDKKNRERWDSHERGKYNLDEYQESTNRESQNSKGQHQLSTSSVVQFVPHIEISEAQLSKSNHQVLHFTATDALLKDISSPEISEASVAATYHKAQNMTGDDSFGSIISSHPISCVKSLSQVKHQSVTTTASLHVQMVPNMCATSNLCPRREVNYLSERCPISKVTENMFECSNIVGNESTNKNSTTRSNDDQTKKRSYPKNDEFSTVSPALSDYEAENKDEDRLIDDVGGEDEGAESSVKNSGNIGPLVRRIVPGGLSNSEGTRHDAEERHTEETKMNDGKINYKNPYYDSINSECNPKDSHYSNIIVSLGDQLGKDENSANRDADQADCDDEINYSCDRRQEKTSFPKSSTHGFSSCRDALKGQTNENEKMEGEDSLSRGRRQRKRKSRWGDDVAEGISERNGTNSNLQLQTNILPISSGPGCKTPLLSKLTRSDPGLIQYARQTFGSTNLSEEDWKKAEDHYKINLLYQDMVKKRAEIDRLEKAGKFKYEYDSDEDVEGGTWEHKLRQQEMMATQLWAEELTRQAAGKHHIGDFLPPEELERFMEKYNAVKQGRNPDLSDYKEFKLKEDNIGYRLLQKMGWNEGQGLGQDGTGITNPVNKASTRHENQGLGVDRPDGLQAGDDEYDAYRKRMMLAYRFRPNPLNNPRRPYY